jgi:hypothetical protein
MCQCAITLLYSIVLHSCNKGDVLIWREHHPGMLVSFSPWSVNLDRRFRKYQIWHKQCGKNHAFDCFAEKVLYVQDWSDEEDIEEVQHNGTHLSTDHHFCRKSRHAMASVSLVATCGLSNNGLYLHLIIRITKLLCRVLVQRLSRYAEWF